jgi:hypothetical protein
LNLVYLEHSGYRYYIIDLDEILPMGHRYGREHLFISVVASMAIMALSLLLLG